MKLANGNTTNTSDGDSKNLNPENISYKYDAILVKTIMASIEKIENAKLTIWKTLPYRMKYHLR